jgi:hypothetical protein
MNRTRTFKTTRNWSTFSKLIQIQIRIHDSEYLGLLLRYFEVLEGDACEYGELAMKLSEDFTVFKRKLLFDYAKYLLSVAGLIEKAKRANQFPLLKWLFGPIISDLYQLTNY